MNIKTDRPQVRSAQDLERKYNLSSIANIDKNVKQNSETLMKTQNELNEFANVVLPGMQEQIDNKIETFYSDGEPTLNNYPAINWDDYSKHIGDLYYDRDSGRSYIFEYDEDAREYHWTAADSYVSEVLSIANAAQTAANSKKQIFTSLLNC